MNPTIRDVSVIATAPEGINLLVVKVETSEPSLYGLGCATFAYRYLTVQHLIETYIKPLVVGLPVSNITEIWQLMHQNAYWRCGPVVNNAISGIDMALWDIKGKMAGMPCYDLFGGKVRAGVPIYRHVDGEDLDAICNNINSLKEIGVKYIRCQCGGYGGSQYGKYPNNSAKGAHSGIYLDSRKYLRDTLALFDGIRSRIGFELELVHDVHERISPTEARVFAKEMEQYRLFFLEDIVSTENLDSLTDIRMHTTTPIAHGELLNSANDWKSVICSRSVDYLRIHISQIGGITPALRLAHFAEEFGVKVCWHGPGDMSPVAHAANIHIDLAVNNLGIQEWSGINPPNWVIQDLNGPSGALLDVFNGMPEYGKDGFVYANDRAGLGIMINEQEAKKYPCNPSVTTWTTTRNLDGSLQTP